MAEVLLLDGHCSAALAFVRSLGRAGHRVTVASAENSLPVAGCSRYCSSRWSYPMPMSQSTVMCDALLSLLRQKDFALTVPMTDATIWPIANRRQELGARTRLAVANQEALDIALDKYQTILLAQRLRIPTPETVLIQSAADMKAVSGWRLPMVIKDRFSMRWVKEKGVPGGVHYADRQEDLHWQVKDRLGRVPDVLVQEFCPGKGIGFSCLAIDGAVCLPFQWERVREKDPRGSGSSARQSVPIDPRVFDYAQRLLKALEYSGLVMIEFKQQDGRLRLMEINARPWGSLQLPIHCGIDYPRHLADWYLESRRPDERKPYRVGITCRWLVGDLTHLENVWEGKPCGWPGTYPRFLPTLLRVAVPWYPGLRCDRLSLADPKPGLIEFFHWCGQHMGVTAR